jgi:hypothetical protein
LHDISPKKQRLREASFKNRAPNFPQYSASPG